MSGHFKKVSSSTHDAWLTALRPLSQRIIAECWRTEHKFAFINSPLRKLSRSGKVVSNSRPEQNRGRLDQFYRLRAELSVGLSSGTVSGDAVRERLRCSEFRGQLLLATSEAEAVECLAECLIHDNTYVESGYGCVLFIETWRD